MRLMKKRMAIAIVCLAVAVIVVAVSVASSGPSKAKNDFSSTKAYLQARYSLMRASERLLPQGRTAVNRLVADVGAECPGILGNAPAEKGIQRASGEGGVLRLSTRNLLLLEIVSAVEVSFRESATPAISNFVNKIKQLGWSNGEITDVVHSFGSVEAARLKRRLPELCRDMRIWVASGYKHVPANTEAADPNVEAPGIALASALGDLGCGTGYPERSILQLLKPYQHPSEGLTSVSVDRLETKVSGAEATIVRSAVMRTEGVLGLPLGQGDAHALSSLRRIRKTPVLAVGECTGRPLPGGLPLLSGHRVGQ
jgi:hypothetical protein